MGVGLFLHSIAEKDKNIALHRGGQKTVTISMRKYTICMILGIYTFTIDLEWLAYEYNKTL